MRLMLSLLYLKHAFNLSDEAVVEHWSENVVWQYFSGLGYYEPRLPCDATQLGRFRKAIGEAGVEELLRATIETAVTAKAVNRSELERVIVDTTVQEKAVAYPTDSRLLEIARHRVVKAAKAAGDANRRALPSRSDCKPRVIPASSCFIVTSRPMRRAKAWWRCRNRLGRTMR